MRITAGYRARDSTTLWGVRIPATGHGAEAGDAAFRRGAGMIKAEIAGKVATHLQLTKQQTNAVVTAQNR